MTAVCGLGAPGYRPSILLQTCSNDCRREASMILSVSGGHKLPSVHHPIQSHRNRIRGHWVFDVEMLWGVNKGPKKWKVFGGLGGVGGGKRKILICIGIVGAERGWWEGEGGGQRWHFFVVFEGL